MFLRRQKLNNFPVRFGKLPAQKTLDALCWRKPITAFTRSPRRNKTPQLALEGRVGPSGRAQRGVRGRAPHRGVRGEGVPQGSLRKRRLFPRRVREIPAGNFVTRSRQNFSDDPELLPQGVSRRDSSQSIPQGSSRTSVSFPEDSNNSRREFPEGIPRSRSRRDRHAPAGESLPT